ncbi:(Dimethylallyl)adenosine tRNA methylthiotransferase MiaB [Tetrabaena socialis]|uniref:(Dimethylallyl)adenosine tRNA methylthiotransferase MiaB n=1 Tax=Tetrabaena socialis TaxID=47790 RepID=A0A2J7ZL28_9CHLO|nr:(Dimethylallyl)adenosine tRNA methylthiotransferase MiaB [Tetrabaena socialis]|eukprot:PNH00974.1 (Dimethylallyl)adenosine tRNA methylthiotransferase MiaB [Tetrabaena socialis]
MEVATEPAQRCRGRTLEVLVEGPNPKNPRQAFGRLRHNKLVYFGGDGKELHGQLVMVRLDECNAFSMFGEVVEVVGNRAAMPGAAVGGPVLAEAREAVAV